MSQDPREDQADAEAAQKDADNRGPAGAGAESRPTPTSPDRSGEKIEAADTSKDVGAPPKSRHGAKATQDQGEDEPGQDAGHAPHEDDDDRSSSGGEKPARPSDSGDGQ